MIRSRTIWLVLASLLAAAVGLFAWLRPAPGDPKLRAFVHARPPVPIVFTSRTEPASLRAAADKGEGFVYPGQPQWQAREGRLRLLKPDGTVHELTWGKKLPDGSTLIDVMSPSISLDGTKVIFAGRKVPPDHGRFRIYEVGVDGNGLRQITGGPDDPGCVALPPMRYRSADDKTVMPDDERKCIDYDDVDPIYLNYSDGRIMFASSRTPDFGRDSNRRSTTLWMRHADGRYVPMTGNRYNDRWPWLLMDKFVVFSSWSHNLEVISSDETEIRPSNLKEEKELPPDSWFAAFIQSTGGQFGGMVKTRNSVLRPRPLFNGKIAFMTRRPVVFQVPPGLTTYAPSSKYPPEYLLRDEPSFHFDGGTPSPCPENKIVFSTELNYGKAGSPEVLIHTICLISDDPGLAHDGSLFADPNFVNAEPVAVYPRPVPLMDNVTEFTAPPGVEPPPIKLENGTTYTGPSGGVFGSQLTVNQHAGYPWQTTPDGRGPIFAGPPKGLIDHIRIYASYRDRFDDPVKERIAGGWELLLKAPVTAADGFGAQVPAGIPTVLAGFTKEGKVAKWRTQGTQAGAFLYAFAGDHYSVVKPGGRTFCIGCHPGHSGLGPNDHRHAERLR